MKYIILLFAFAGIVACQNANSENEKNNEALNNSEESTPDYEVAVKFINDYVDYILNENQTVGPDEWVKGRNDVTESFKKEYAHIVEEGLKNDPEMGLGFDPILDAQDLPEAFEIDLKDGAYLVVQGVNWPDFKLNIKLVAEKGKWLVDGSGVINIPNNYP